MSTRALVTLVVLLGAGCGSPAGERTASTPRSAPTVTSTESAAPSPSVPLTKIGTPIPPPPVERHGMHSTSLRGVAIQFAKYLNGMHDRLHPEFSDKELVRLETLPANDPLNDKKLVTRVELVLRGEDGRIVTATVGKPSGVPAFDALAVDSLRRAEPFGAAAPEIVSADGNVHVDWELARDEVFACSTMHTRPFLFAR